MENGCCRIGRTRCPSLSAPELPLARALWLALALMLAIPSYLLAEEAARAVVAEPALSPGSRLVLGLVLCAGLAMVRRAARP